MTSTSNSSSSFNSKNSEEEGDDEEGGCSIEEEQQNILKKRYCDNECSTQALKRSRKDRFAVMDAYSTSTAKESEYKNNEEAPVLARIPRTKDAGPPAPPSAVAGTTKNNEETDLSDGERLYQNNETEIPFLRETLSPRSPIDQ